MIRLFIKYLAKYKFKAILGPLFKLIEACFELIVPLVVKNIIDEGINGLSGEVKGVEYILQMGGILLLLAIVGLCSTLVCQYFASRVSQNVGTELREDLYKHICTLSMREIDALSVSSLQTRLNADTMAFQNSVAMFMRLVVRAPFIVIGATIMAFSISGSMGFIFVVAGIAIGLIIFLIMRFSLPYNRKIQKGVDDITTITKENLSGARVVRAFNMQEYERKRYYSKSDDLKDLSLKLSRFSSLLNPLTLVVINVAVVLIIYFGAEKVNIGGLTQGEVTSLFNYMSQISVAIAIVANLVVVFSKSASSSERINQVFDTVSTLNNGDDTIIEDNDIAINFENVSFEYHQDSDNAVSNIDLKIKNGETIGIIGGTGSGKSTLVNLMTRLYDVSKGKIEIFGKDIKVYDLKALRKAISFVPQHAVLFEGTIRSNMLWRDENASDEEIYKALSIAQAEGFVNEKENKLDEVVLQGGKNFSGGQRQRLTLARALIDKPKILILDDASSALDFQTDSKMREAIKRQCKDMTTIMISQRATSIKNADKIIVLDEGRIVDTGTHEELLARCNIYQEICTSQIKKEKKYE